MQGAAELNLNSGTRYITTPRTPRTMCVKWRKEILTLLAHAMQAAAELVLNRCTRYISQGDKEILTLHM